MKQLPPRFGLSPDVVPQSHSSCWAFLHVHRVDSVTADVCDTRTEVLLVQKTSDVFVKVNKVVGIA